MPFFWGGGGLRGWGHLWVSIENTYARKHTQVLTQLEAYGGCVDGSIQRDEVKGGEPYILVMLWCRSRHAMFSRELEW